MISERFPPKTAGTAFARSPFFSSGSWADPRLALQGLRLGADLLMQLHELGLVPGADGGELLPTPKLAEGQGCLVQGFDGLNQLDVRGEGFSASLSC